MSRRKPPAGQLGWVSGATLRAREESEKKTRTGEAMVPWLTIPDYLRDDDEDRAELPRGGALCMLCGAWLIWDINGSRYDHPLNRDGTDHFDSCPPVH